MALREGKAVGFFSLEMSKLQIMMRLIALSSNISMSAIRTGKPRFSQQEWGRLELETGALEKAGIFIDDSASLSIIEMKTRARRLLNEHHLDVIFVDYLQLMKVTGDQLRKNDTRAQEVATITASLKELAKELEIPVVALAQLNRAPEQRGVRSERGLKYQLSDLKESGAIEQDADVIIFLHREEQVDRDTERKGEADLIVAKQRNGPTGTIHLAFIDKSTRFENIGFMDKDHS
jgi:replicative DNA helicase